MNKQQEIKFLELLANMEDISIPDRLAVIHEIYALRGVPKYVYSEE